MGSFQISELLSPDECNYYVPLIENVFDVPAENLFVINSLGNDMISCQILYNSIKIPFIVVCDCMHCRNYSTACCSIPNLTGAELLFLC